MSKIEARYAYLAKRRERIIQNIKDGWTCEQIADREGLTVDTASSLRRDFAREEGLKIPPKGRSRYRAIGLDDDKEGFHARVAHKVLDLQTIYSAEELTYLLGLTTTEQSLAADNTRGYNWTVAQLQRLANVLGVSFRELLIDLNTPKIPTPIKKR